MTEKEYRLCRLKQSGKLENKRIVLYGTGKNAEYIIHNYHSIHIIGLMDSKQTGRTYYGKKVLSEEQVLELLPDTIVMAAEHMAVQEIYKRIMPFCIRYHIELLNMYGENEIELHRFVLEQDIQYLDKDSATLRQEINRYDSICFELYGTLCESRFIGSNELLKKVEAANQNYCSEDYFIANRQLAESRLKDIKQKYTLQDIYYVYQSLFGVSSDVTERLLEIEAQVILGNAIPRKEMVSILNDARRQGKQIIIYYAGPLRYKDIEKLLFLIGVGEVSVILRESGSYMSFSTGLLREELARNPGRSLLYVGTAQNGNLVVPLLYKHNMFLVKSCMEMFMDYAPYKINKQEWESKEDKSIFLNMIIQEYNNPFCMYGTDGNRKMSVESLKLCKQFFGNSRGEYIDFPISEPHLYPLNDRGALENYDKLAFPMWESPVVSIIIPIYNQFVYTYYCLKSILDTVSGIPYEIIIADDCSSDMTKEIEKIVSNVQVIHNREQLNFLLNCNYAAKFAKGKYLLFLNNDTQVQPNWLLPLVRTLNENPKVGMTGSKLIMPDGRLQEAGGLIFRDGRATNYGYGNSPDWPEYNYVRKADYISGAAIMIRKELWEKIGGFDERYCPAYCEDSDLAFEVRQQSMEVMYQPESVVVHFGGVSHGKDISKGIKAFQLVNQEKFLRKWQKEIEKNHVPYGFNTIAARDRKIERKTVLFISESLPRFDRDAGSRTIFSYLRLFLKRNYIIKYIPANFYREEPYAYALQQMGVEILYGDKYEETIADWLMKNQDGIDYAFLNYPSCSYRYLPMLLNTKIKIRYFGHDLHFLRTQREYELTKNEALKERLEEFFRIEKELIEKSEIVYYPSAAEVKIITDVFHYEKAKAIKLCFYSGVPENNSYHSEKREGLLFVGGFAHPPNVDAILWFVKEIYPLIYEKEKITFTIVGSAMPPEIEKIKHPGIMVRGFVSDKELDKLYQEVKIVVAPLRYGAGIKGKILEAMSRGIPLVTTPIGAEGIDERAEAVCIANNPKEFADKVLELYGNDGLLLQTSNALLEYTRRHYSEDEAWEIIREDFS